MKLREYQTEAINQIENSEYKNIMLQMPTGSGKTVVFSEVVKRYFLENVKKILILVHRQELLEQTYKTLGEKCFKIEKGVKVIPKNFDFYVGMVETVNRRVEKLPDFGLVVIDEAHIGNFKKMPFFNYQNTKVLGVTATPINEEPLSKYYENLIIPTNINSLIENKYLLNCNVYGFASDLVSSQKWKTTRGDFDEKQMEDFYSSEKMVKNVIEAYWQKVKGKKTLIFNVNINHNNAVYNALKNEGLNVYSLDGNTPKNERKEIIQNFKNQNDAIICNVGVLTTGFDEPTTEVVILNRATKSLALYLQMIGRGARIYENKINFLVLDLGKNTLRHGFYNDYIDWDSYFKLGSKLGRGGGLGAAPSKECPECGFIQHTRKIICDNCGHDFIEEQQRQQKEEKEQKLYLLTKENPIDIPTDKLFDLAHERNWKPYAVLHKIADHIVNYQKKYKNIVDFDYCHSQGFIELEKWCKKYNAKNNKWHKDFIIKLIDEKAGRNNTATNI